MSSLKCFLSALALHLTLFPLFAEIAISPAQKEEFARYGITVVVENYTRSDKGQLLTQKDLDDDLEIILKHFRQIGRQYVQMSRCRTIIIRGSHPKIAFASGSKINFKYRTAGAVPHELFHTYDMFKFAYRFWNSLNRENYIYVGGGRKGMFPDASTQEILTCFARMSEFDDDFTWNYAQTNAREDIASIFNHTTNPADVGKWKTRIQKSPVFRKKFYFMVASCLESGTEKFWDDLFHFTDAQWREIRDCRIDISSRTGLRIRYTKTDLSRYGNQLRTAMTLMNLDPRLIQASGIQQIIFTQSGSPKRRRRSLTINDFDVDGLLENIFLALAEKHRRKAAAAGLSDSKEDWAVLFRRCVLDVRRTAVEMSRDPVLFGKVRIIRDFTASWLPESFWDEMMVYQKDIGKEKQYRRHFQKCGLRLNVPLPRGIRGRNCSPEEIANASRVLTACCSVLSEDFIRDTGIRKIAFAKNMISGRRRIIRGYVSDGTLCLDPTFAHLGRTVFYEFFKAYDPRAKSIHDEWKQVKGGPADCISVLARQSVLNDRADTFAWLLWNPCHTYRMARKSPKLLRKTELILSLPILASDAEVRLKLRYYRDLAR